VSDVSVGVLVFFVETPDYVQESSWHSKCRKADEVQERWLRGQNVDYLARQSLPQEVSHELEIAILVRVKPNVDFLGIMSDVECRRENSHAGVDGGFGGESLTLDTTKEIEKVALLIR